jgi:glycosyltransferase involved in cell wall biosynthesis
MSREKGFDLLAEAYASLTDPPRLSIAGLDGPLAHEGRALAARFPQVRLLPPVRPDQMAAVYAAQAVVVAPSVWPDPLPGAVLEARAQQRALIVSDRGGIPEIVAGYRRVRKVDVGRSRREVVGELARAMAEMGTWASVPADVMEEEAFYARHSSQTHARRVVEVLEGVMR